MTKNTRPSSHLKSRCLGCYQPIETGIYHPKCSRKIFNTPTPPLLDTTLEEIQEIAESFLKARITVPGVQRKISLNLEGAEPKRLTLVGSLGGSFILKPPTPDYPELPENEDLCMHLAALSGIQTADHGLLPMKDGTLAYVTRRFDRQKKKKIAVEDLCQLSELLTEQKYRSSHEKTGKIIRKCTTAPGDAVLRFFEVVLFSYVIGNNDMHLKNFSLLIKDQSSILLSPAYDLLSVRLVLSEKDDSEELALSTNGKKQQLKKSDFKDLAENLKIPENVFEGTIQKQIEAKDAMCTLIDQGFLSTALKDKLKLLITSRLQVLDV